LFSEYKMQGLLSLWNLQNASMDLSWNLALWALNRIVTCFHRFRTTFTLHDLHIVLYNYSTSIKTLEQCKVYAYDCTLQQSAHEAECRNIADCAMWIPVK
jgi:hypothetical protein